MFEGIEYADLKEMDEIRRGIKEKGFTATIDKRTANNDGNVCMWTDGMEKDLYLIYTDFRTAKEQANDPDVYDIMKGLPKLGVLWEARERSWDNEHMFSFFAQLPADFFITEEGVEDDLPWT